MTVNGMVLGEVVDEQCRQEQKWGHQEHGALRWLAILTEEVGELAQAILLPDGHELATMEDVAKVRHELVQVAAVALTWLANGKFEE